MVKEANGWMSAHEAYELLSQAMGPGVAARTICTWAFRELVHARAKLLIFNSETKTDVAIPKEFWWACGGDALTQNWKAGDFAMYEYEHGNCEAYGVEFNRAEVEARLPPAASPGDGATGPSQQTDSTIGRPREYDWLAASNSVWGTIYRGQFIPTKQREIEAALRDYLKVGDKEPSPGTVRPFASKIWKEMKKD